MVKNINTAARKDTVRYADENLTVARDNLHTAQGAMRERSGRETPDPGSGFCKPPSGTSDRPHKLDCHIKPAQILRNHAREA